MCTSILIFRSIKEAGLKKATKPPSLYNHTGKLLHGIASCAGLTAKTKIKGDSL